MADLIGAFGLGEKGYGTMKKMLAAALVAACLVVQARGADLGPLRDLAGWKRGDNIKEVDKVPQAVDKLVNATPVAERGEIEDALIKIAESTQASAGARDYALRMLQRIGTERCVPTLARLLTDKEMSHHARLGLERMADSSQAGEALLTALASARDAAKVGIIGSIGRRRDSGAISRLARLTSDSNAEVASAALKALGRIGGAASLRYLGRARGSGKVAAARVNGILLCAESLDDRRAADVYGKLYRDETENRFRAAALSGLARTDPHKAGTMIVDLLRGEDSYLRRTALRSATVTPGETLTRSLTGALAGLPTEKRAELIDALAVRGDRAAVDGVIRYLDDDDKAVRSAAGYAVGLLGDGSHVAALLRLGAQGGKGEGALAALEVMSAEGVDEALVKALTDPALAAAAAKALAKRESVGVAAGLLEVAKSGATEVKREAWNALAKTASEKDIDAMMQAMLDIRDDGLRSSAGKAVESACSRASNKQACFEAASRYYDRADESTKSFIIGLTAFTGSGQARDLARTAFKSGSQALRDRALRSLCSWPNSGAARDLMDIIKGAGDEKTRVLALRGYINVADREGNHGRKLKMYADIRPMVKSKNDKRALVSKLQRVKDKGTIGMLDEYLDDPDVKAEAAAAACQLARERWRPPKAQMKALLEKAMRSTDNKSIINKAKDAIRRLR
ncbi:MAG: HEAT repeat domain-containing protein [Planctomycetota bacterium]